MHVLQPPHPTHISTHHSSQSYSQSPPQTLTLTPTAPHVHSQMTSRISSHPRTRGITSKPQAADCKSNLTATGLRWHQFQVAFKNNRMTLLRNCPWRSVCTRVYRAKKASGYPGKSIQIQRHLRSIRLPCVARSKGLTTEPGNGHSQN